MAYFPFFVDIEARRCLIVGGGRVALRKAEKLLPYGPVIYAVAPRFESGFYSLEGVITVEGRFRPEMLEGKDFVIAATDDTALNCSVSELCRERGIPVNVVDSKAECSFLFPALVKRGTLSVGISTGGASPSAAIYLKKALSELIPERFDEILRSLELVRPQIKTAFVTETERSEVFEELFLLCLERNIPLDGDTLKSYISERSRKQND